MTKAWFSDVNINTETTGLSFPRTNNQMVFSIDDISIRFNMEYDIATRPPFLMDKGQGYAAMTNFNFSVTLTPYSDPQGRLRVSASDLIVTLNNDAF